VQAGSLLFGLSIERSQQGFHPAVGHGECVSSALVGSIHIVRDHTEVCFGVAQGERFEVGQIDVVSRPFALKRQRGLASARQYKVDFVASFVSPISDPSGLEISL
jgi:hypothetical protein